MKALFICITGVTLFCAGPCIVLAQQPSTLPDTERPAGPEHVRQADTNANSAVSDRALKSGRGWAGEECVVGLSCDIFKGS